MKRTISTLAMSFILLQWAYGQDEITGTWMVSEGKSIVEIKEKKNGAYEGKIVWIELPENMKGKVPTDRNNPNKALRSRPIIGLTMVENLTYKNGKWKGKIYTPKHGRIADVEFSLRNKNQLDVRVYLGMFSRAQIWSRSEVPQ